MTLNELDLSQYTIFELDVLINRAQTEVQNKQKNERKSIEKEIRKLAKKHKLVATDFPRKVR